MVLSATDNTKRLKKPQLFPKAEDHTDSKDKKSISFRKIISGFSTTPKQI